jgi:hypothetical protein
MAGSPDIPFVATLADFMHLVAVIPIRIDFTAVIVIGVLDVVVAFIAVNVIFEIVTKLSWRQNND